MSQKNVIYDLRTKGAGEKTLKSELVQFRFLQFVILLYWLPLEEWSGIKRGLDYLKQIKRRIHSPLRWHSDNNSSNINLKQIERICSSSFFSPSFCKFTKSGHSTEESARLIFLGENRAVD